MAPPITDIERPTMANNGNRCRGHTRHVFGLVTMT
jgi:hypothetical protein